jgi:hypothetical protein
MTIQPAQPANSDPHHGALTVSLRDHGKLGRAMFAIEIVTVRPGKEPLVIDRATSVVSSVDDADRSAQSLLDKARRMAAAQPTKRVQDHRRSWRVGRALVGAVAARQKFPRPETM